MIVKKPIAEIKDEVIEDYLDEMSTQDMVKKYGWVWSTLRKIIHSSNVPIREWGGNRKGVGKCSKNFQHKEIDCDAMIDGKTLREWRKYNTKVNNESEHFIISKGEYHE